MSLYVVEVRQPFAKRESLRYWTTTRVAELSRAKGRARLNEIKQKLGLVREMFDFRLRPYVSTESRKKVTP